VTQPIELPDRRVFWTWVWTSIRPVVGWVLAALGALSLLLGWYGVSGEALTAKQLPYLVSGGLTGIALVIVAAVFLATEDVRRQLARVDDLQRKVDDLYGLFVADLSAGPDTAARGAAPAPPPAVAAGAIVALPTGTVYHRRDCALVAGKPAVAAVDAAEITRRSLSPCRVCDPATPA
jgi:hypothetical protein